MNVCDFDRLEAPPTYSDQGVVTEVTIEFIPGRETAFDIELIANIVSVVKLALARVSWARSLAC